MHTWGRKLATLFLCTTAGLFAGGIGSASAAAHVTSPGVDTNLLVGATGGTITLADANGTNIRTITPDLPSGSDISTPDLSPDGSKVAFVAGSSAGTDQLYVIGSDGTGLAQVISGQGVHDPHWAPDGTQLVYGMNGTQGSVDVWTVSADGSGAKELAVGQNPVWSPDGTAIAFDLAGAIYSVPSSGGTPSALVTDPDGNTEQCTGCAFEPQWSPNGLYLEYFTYPVNSATTNITIVSATNTTSPVAEFGVIDAYSVSWSPDSSRLLVDANQYSGIYNLSGQLEAGNPVGPDASWIRPSDPQDCQGGYRLVASDGGIFSFGGSAFYGSHGGSPLSQPVVSLAATSDNGGYWLVASDGGIFSYGDAAFHGSMGGQHLNEPVVGMAVDPSTGGYWLVASDGGIFSFKAPFLGSMGNVQLNAPIVGMATTPDGKGYWLVASDGGIFSFGDAGFHGSMGGQHLNAPVTGMAASHDGSGYWLVASDGGIFSFGDAGYAGNGSGPLNAATVGMAPSASGAGYLLAESDGRVVALGDEQYCGAIGPYGHAPVVGAS